MQSDKEIKRLQRQLDKMRKELKCYKAELDALYGDYNWLLKECSWIQDKNVLYADETTRNTILKKLKANYWKHELAGTEQYIKECKKEINNICRIIEKLETQIADIENQICKPEFRIRRTK